MEHDTFERYCDTIYDLTGEQRKCLINLLQSRIWIYESGNSAELEKIFEFDSSAIKTILREIPMNLLAYALKGRSAALIELVSSNLADEDVPKLAQEMQLLGPARLSKVEQAQAEIMEIIERLEVHHQIELPCSPDIILDKLGIGSARTKLRKAPRNSTDRSKDLSNPEETMDQFDFRSATIHVKSDYPRLRIGKDGHHILSFQTKEGEYALKISDHTLRQLGQVCAPYAAESRAAEESTVFDDVRRLMARQILLLSDSDLKVLLKDIDPLDLAAFLWYFNQPRFSYKVFAFSRPEVVNKMVADFGLRWQGVTIETAPEDYLKRGRRGFSIVLNAFYELADIGMISVPD